MTQTSANWPRIRSSEVTIIIPAKNEAPSLQRLLPEIRQRYPQAEVLVIDDGSTDETAATCAGHDVTVIHHPYSRGNGAAIKSGARRARGEYLVFMDADGQHDPAEIEALLDPIAEGYDLVIGARDRGAQASHSRWAANQVYSRMATWIVGRPIADLTSGFRACRAELFHEFLPMLPNGFSYPTTSTMAFFRAGYAVGFVPITVRTRQRGSKSHIRLFRDGARFLLIIFRVGTLYSPLKLFLPISGLFLCAAVIYYLYTFITAGSFTNFGALLAVTSVLTFLIGLVSEQITQLMFAHRPQPTDHIDTHEEHSDHE